MKALAFLLTVALPCAAQSIFNDGLSIHSGDGEDQTSKAFDMGGPYVLRWQLYDKPPASKKDDPFWKPTTDDGWKQQWLAVEVHDAASNKRICGEVLTGRVNHMSVPTGGKHYVVVSAYRNVSWSVWAKQGKVVVTDKGPTFAALTAEDLAPKAPAESRPIHGSKLTPAELEKLAEPIPEPKPSSVPGLPPGVEPAKKAEPALPPGMTKGPKP